MDIGGEAISKNERRKQMKKVLMMAAVCLMAAATTKKGTQSKRQASPGYVAAQYNLGYCYARGEGVAANRDEAVKWFSRAAERGCAEAKIALKIISPH